MTRSLKSVLIGALLVGPFTGSLIAQGAVKQWEVDLFPGGYLDLESGVVLSIPRLGDLRADLALRGASIPGKAAPDGMVQIEPLEGAQLARLPFSTLNELEKLFALPIDGLSTRAEVLSNGGAFVVRSAEGHFARLWLQSLPSGGVAVQAVVENNGVPRLPSPPAGFALAIEGSSRKFTWHAEEGRRYTLRRRPFLLAGEDAERETGACEFEVAGGAFVDATADPTRGYIYDLLPRVGEEGYGLGARLLALPTTHQPGEIWNAQVASGSEIDFYEGRLAGRSVHARIVQAYDTGFQIEPGPGCTILDGRSARQDEMAVVIGDLGFVVQQVFVQPGNEAFVRTAEGLYGRVRLVRMGQKNRAGYQAEIEVELAPPGADGFLRAPAAPELEWQQDRVQIRWPKLKHAASVEVGRRDANGHIQVLASSTDEHSFEEPTPAGVLMAEYSLRIVDQAGRRSPWSSTATVLLVDPSDGPRIFELVAKGVEELASADDARYEEARRRVKLLGPLAKAALIELSDRDDEGAEVAREFLRELEGADVEVEAGSARALLQREIASMSPELREAALEERRGARVFEALIGGTVGDAYDEAHEKLRSALAVGDPDPLLRHALETWTRQAAPEWRSAESAFRTPYSTRAFRTYGFDAQEVATRLDAAREGESALVARWIAAFANASAPSEAWALMTWAEVVAGEIHEDWPLVRAGLELLAGQEIGSAAGKRAVRLAELHTAQARCRAFARTGELYRTPFVFDRTITITPEDGLQRLAEVVERAEPGTRVVMEPGRYQEDVANGALVLRGSHVRIEAREPGEVILEVPLFIEDSQELALVGMRLAATQGFGLQIMRSSCLLEDMRIEGTGAGLHFAESFVWLRGCRLVGRSNATGLLVRDGSIGIERCLVDGYQTAVQVQGRATAFLSRSVFADLGFVVARGNGEGSALYADRCVVLGTARQVFSNFHQGAVARLLIAGVGVPGTALGESFVLDSSSVIEIEGNAGNEWGGAKLRAGVTEWFEKR